MKEENAADHNGAKMANKIDALVYMWGYLPGALPDKSLLLLPEPVRLPSSIDGGDSWKEVCGGGCGFAMAISDSGKLITWGAADEEGQIFLTSGKHGEIPEAFPFPTEDLVVKAVAGWAHCVSVTEAGEVYTWGWSECIPSMKTLRDLAIGGGLLKDSTGKQSLTTAEQAGPQDSNGVDRMDSQLDNKRVGEETAKRRKINSVKEDTEISSPGDDLFTTLPCLVNFGPGVKIAAVAAGGRHTLALSDMGQVWGWGHGGEGQLGLGTRVKMVSSPHIIPCIELPASAKDRSSVIYQASKAAAGKVLGNYVKGIACGGRHSVVVTVCSTLLICLYVPYQIRGHCLLLDGGFMDRSAFFPYCLSMCGQGNTNDLLRPTCVSSLSSTQVESISAGLWHTVCITAEGLVYAFGGNQFGQLGTGTDQGETIPRLLDAPILEGKCAKRVSCGARHNVVLTGTVWCGFSIQSVKMNMMASYFPGAGINMASLVLEIQSIATYHLRYPSMDVYHEILFVVGGTR
ncbi:ultraviolet-B receptor UVR8 isoform X1 [Cucumis sativus]|uniref:ultraviolet-B receptor UVR8 isoform X1 n=1 Tax=Cucumis sativus TaxID=3659 RepID=UPI0012F52314|nr:ultraviolet-B receptor UVR8 isoform X1 [Cucumis sativus]